MRDDAARAAEAAAADARVLRADLDGCKDLAATTAAAVATREASVSANHRQEVEAGRRREAALSKDLAAEREKYERYSLDLELEKLKCRRFAESIVEYKDAAVKAKRVKEDAEEEAEKRIKEAARAVADAEVGGLKGMFDPTKGLYLTPPKVYV